MAINVPAPSASSKKPLLVVGGIFIVILVVVFLYSFFTKPSSNNTVVQEVTQEGSSATAAIASSELNKKAQEIIDAISILQSIELDTKFLEDERFQSLRPTPITIPDARVPNQRRLEISQQGPATSPAPTTKSTTIR